ncbi:MAG TPA: serine hydroxymethyltransferase [Chloroflexi bacterium]|nr:serine hydroxymethyltransferase [Chloroflexota bacterium]
MQDTTSSPLAPDYGETPGVQYLAPIREVDPDIYEAILAETRRQQTGIELIPSENYVSRAVLSAIGTVFTNKYSEGYAGKRYYGGNENVDIIETLAIERAKQLFGAEHANVQPYSGSPANMAVYYGLLEPGDTVMGLALPDGGHLTHGWKVNFSAHFFNSVQYPVNPETGLLDYDVVWELAREHKPKLIWAGATAYPRVLEFDKFAQIAEDVGAYFAADIAHISGLVATGLHPDPVPYADAVTMTTHKMLRGPRGAMILTKEEHARAIDRAVFPGLQGGPHDHVTAAIAVCLKEASKEEYVEYCNQIVRNAKALAEALIERGFELVSGGTDNHLMLVDLTNKGVPGKVAQKALDRAGITLNANMVPGDKRSAFDPSGIRLGTPAVTTRGFKEDEMRKIAGWLADVIENIEDKATIERVRHEVEEVCEQFPLWY